MVDDSDVITLQDENGLEHRFNLVDIVEVGGQRYAVLQPEESDDDDPAAVVFRIEGDDRLVPIEDDQELGRVMAELEERYGDVVLDAEDEDDEDLDLLDEAEAFDLNGEHDEDEEDD
ncbi:MAG: DUF1292 domain-containing protein [Armatimonadota bacterium]|nr:DUF1292 domain-containing protein [Armatimonadota bacterium]MDR7534643.1 DUF1292 domain-containing protein [Armatimonadota bacterium]MDR7537055.1 DUF1292 domain-containing protein [Armatimonadota bacterium]